MKKNKKRKCSFCKLPIEEITAIPEGSNSSDSFAWEPCIDCGKGCRLIAVIDGKERYYKCCYCAPPFAPKQA